MEERTLIESASIQFDRARMRTRELVYAAAGIGVLLCFLRHERHRRQEWRQGEKTREPGWADPLPIQTRKRRRLSRPPSQYDEHISPRRRRDRPCLLLERLPLEIRQQIFAHVVGNDAILVIPRRRKYGHASLTDDYRMIHCTPQGKSRYQPREVATNSGVYGFHPDKAVVIYPSIPNDDMFIFRTTLGTNTYQMQTIDGGGMTDAIRTLDRGAFDSTEPCEVDKSLHFFLGTWRAFWNPYRITKRNQRGVPNSRARYVGEGSDMLELGTKLALLRTCRPIYREAVDLLYGSNVFVFPEASVFTHLPCFALPQRLSQISHLFLALRTGLDEHTDPGLAMPGDDVWLLEEESYHLIRDYMPGLRTLNLTIEFHFTWDPPISVNKSLRQLRPTIEETRSLAKQVTLCMVCELAAEDDERCEQVKRWAEDVMELRSGQVTT